MHTRAFAPLVAAALFAGMVTVPVPFAAGQAPGGLPSGRYVTTIAIADLPPDLNATMRQLLSGRWEIELTADGRYSGRTDAGARVEGRFDVAGAEVTLSGETGPSACTLPGDEIATYRWAFDGQRLTLTLVSDSCRGRVVVLTTNALTLQPAATAQVPSPPVGTIPTALPRNGTGLIADTTMTAPEGAILGLLVLSVILSSALRLRRAHR
jgi:hypothetical protein